jgi:hypothetical protein
MRGAWLRIDLGTREEYAEAGAQQLIVAPVLDRENAERILERTAKDYLQLL